MQKYSKQREALLALLTSVTNHPSAEWLHTQLKEEFPNIGLATIYRNLNLLTQSGKILKIDVGNGKEHYDGDIRNHYHFYCDVCESIYDVDMDYALDIDAAAQEITGANIRCHSLVFYGTCSKCKEINKF